MARGEVKESINAKFKGPYDAGEALTKGDVVYIKEADGKVYQADDTIVDEPKYVSKETYTATATDVTLVCPPTVVDVRAAGTINPGALVKPATSANKGQVLEHARGTISATYVQAEIQATQKEALLVVGRATNKVAVTSGNDVEIILGGL